MRSAELHKRQGCAKAQKQAESEKGRANYRPPLTTGEICAPIEVQRCSDSPFDCRKSLKPTARHLDVGAGVPALASLICNV